MAFFRHMFSPLIIFATHQAATLGNSFPSGKSNVSMTQPDAISSGVPTLGYLGKFRERVTEASSKYLTSRSQVYVAPLYRDNCQSCNNVFKRLADWTVKVSDSSNQSTFKSRNSDNFFNRVRPMTYHRPNSIKKIWNAQIDLPKQTRMKTCPLFISTTQMKFTGLNNRTCAPKPFTKEQ